MKKFFNSGGKQQIAKRSFLDVSKSKQTKKRGEKHDIQIHSNKVRKEILIAIYLQCIINKQTQQIKYSYNISYQ